MTAVSHNVDARNQTFGWTEQQQDMKDGRSSQGQSQVIAPSVSQVFPGHTEWRGEPWDQVGQKAATHDWLIPLKVNPFFFFMESSDIVGIDLETQSLTEWEAQLLACAPYKLRHASLETDDRSFCKDPAWNTLQPPLAKDDLLKGGGGAHL